MLQHGKNTSFPRKATLCKFDKILYKQNYKIKTSYKNIRKEFYKLFCYYISNCYLIFRALPLMEARRFRSGSRTTLSAGFPLKRPFNASFTRRTFRCNCRTASSLPPALRPSLPDKAHPPAPCAGAAMARARRRSRTPGGRTERRSRRGHHPARPGRSAPTPTRHAAGGVQSN